jgi:hypothetical protein
MVAVHLGKEATMGGCRAGRAARLRLARSEQRGDRQEEGVLGPRDLRRLETLITG